MMVPQIPGYSVYQHRRRGDGKCQGSDQFDFVTRNDGRVGVVIADSGGENPEVLNCVHGLSTQLRRLLQSDPDPARVMRQLNFWICRTHSNRFITLVLSVLDPDTHEVAIANAGHLLPIVRRCDGRIEPLDDRTSGVPLAMIPESDYQCATVSLEAGDLIVLSTKGLSQAMNQHRNIYGRDRVHRAIAGAGTDPEQVGPAVVADVENFIREVRTREDFTLIILGRNP